MSRLLEEHCLALMGLPVESLENIVWFGWNTGACHLLRVRRQNIVVGPITKRLVVANRKVQVGLFNMDMCLCQFVFQVQFWLCRHVCPYSSRLYGRQLTMYTRCKDYPDHHATQLNKLHWPSETMCTESHDTQTSCSISPQWMWIPRVPQLRHGIHITQ